MDSIIAYLNKLLAAFLSGVAFFGGGGVVLIFFKTLIVKAYDKWLETIVETHRAKLNRENELQIASFKHELALAAAERHVQYSRIFDKTAEIIADTYGRLLALQKAAGDFTQLLPDQKHEDCANVLSQKLNEFFYFFSPKKIYFPKETADKIWAFYLTVQESVLTFHMAQAVSIQRTQNRDSYEKLTKDFLEASKEIPTLLKSLEDDFQKYLGIKIEGKSPDTGVQQKG